MQALYSATVRSEFHERAGMDSERMRQLTFMPPEDVVQASLAGLALGEVICAPGVEDAGRIAAYQQARTQAFTEARANKLASRYASSPR